MKRIVFSQNEAEALYETSKEEGYVVAELDDERVTHIDIHAEVNGVVLGRPVPFKKNGSAT